MAQLSPTCTIVLDGDGCVTSMQNAAGVTLQLPAKEQLVTMSTLLFATAVQSVYLLPPTAPRQGSSDPPAPGPFKASSTNLPWCEMIVETSARVITLVQQDATADSPLEAIGAEKLLSNPTIFDRCGSATCVVFDSPDYLTLAVRRNEAETQLCFVQCYRMKSCSEPFDASRLLKQV